MMSHHEPQSDADSVDAYMQQFARASLGDAKPLPDPTVIWWKAQRLRRVDAERRLASPVDIGELVLFGLGSVGTLLLLAMLWRTAASSRDPWISVGSVVAITVLVLASGLASSSWSRLPRTFVALFVACIVPAVAPAGQATSVVRQLPPPTGPFQIGRVTAHWSDTSRAEPLAVDRGPRELMVDIWYPADMGGGIPAGYFDSSAFEEAQSADRLRGLLRSAYESIRGGHVRTHAVEGVPLARSVRRAPVLIFSHGGGEARETYSAQLEDLASHGYVVAAISHTYEAVLTVFPDGRRVPLTPKRWPRPATTAIEGLPPSQEANPDRLRWWANDIRFVLDQLTKVDGQSSGSPFVGRLDLSRVGVFGHSAGGQAAAHACQIEPRLRACLNQDGLSAFAPYYPNDGWGMDQAFMLIVRNTPRELPTKEELASLGMTLTQAKDLLSRLDARQDATLRNTGRGAYRVLLEAAATTHADFTDLPFLQSTLPAETEIRARIIGTVRSVTRAFFDKTLKRLEVPFLDGHVATAFVEGVQKFEPANRPKR
jgi:predicted dienelactone hydrolase